MRTRTGTGLVIALFLALSLLCSVSLVAQDNLLTNATSNNKTAGSCSIVPATNNTAALCTAAGGTWSPTSPAADCSAYAADGVTCIAGQYFHSDNAKLSTAWASPAPSSTFGNWVTGNGSSNGCLSCHHSSVNGASSDGGPLGGGYLIGGHKNILRKVVPGQTLLDDQGLSVTSVIDHSSNPYTLSQTAGTISGTAGTFTANYLAGWVANGAIDVFGTNTNGTVNTTLAYGSCARCHTTGYRWDGTGPEPTSYNGTTFTKLPNAFVYPAGQKSGDTTVATSWNLTGIQCERCHKADMQYDATVVNPNIGTVAVPLLSGGRISHLNNILPPANTDANTGQIPGTDFYMHSASQTTSARPQINPPYALTCVECHQAYSTWTSKVAGTPGQVHLTPLPGFESLAPKASGNYSTTKDATGQFSATWGCTNNGVAVPGIATNDYNGCVTAGGTVTYVPGGMSHGAVATILNSPHARVTGYVDIKTQGSADTTLSITGGKINDPTSPVNGLTFTGQYNTMFASAGTTGASASAARPDGKTNGVSGSCAGCHDIHSYLPNYFSPDVSAINVSTTPIKNCTTCHGDHAKAMNHPTGPGTPYSLSIAGVNPTTSMGVGQQESCNICHFSKKTGTEYHFLRINADPNYNTFPSAQQYYTTTGSGLFGKLNTYPESYTDPVTYQPKTGYPAVGLDVDIACGQCHTGGNGATNPYGLVPYAGDGGVAPRPYSRAFLAAAAVSMHTTAANAPTITPALPATGGPTTITITANPADVSEGVLASIFYTTDGTIPAMNATTFLPTGTTIEATSPVSIPVTATKTVYAFAAGPATYSFTASPIVGGTYGVQVAPTPVIAPTGANLTFPATVSVKLSDSATASICYTTTGTAPAVVAGVCNGIVVANPFTLTVGSSEVLKAIAYSSSYATSAVATATFTVAPPTPAWSNVAPAKFPGTYTGAVTAAMTDADPNASICYTTNGATPVAPCNGTTVASGAAITVSASETIKAIAIDGTGVSKATSGTFVIH